MPPRSPERLGPWILNAFAAVAGALAIWILNDMRTTLRTIEAQLAADSQRIVALETWRLEHSKRYETGRITADVIPDDDPSTPP